MKKWEKDVRKIVNAGVTKPNKWSIADVRKWDKHWKEMMKETKGRGYAPRQDNWN